MTNATPAAIQNAYLMWVGAEHYKTITDFTKEVSEMGLSKRLPNAETAQALLKPGTVVFIAHDEGEYTPCPVCTGLIECPECRKLDNQLATIDTAVQTMAEQAATYQKLISLNPSEANETEQAELDSLEKGLKKLHAKVDKLVAKKAACANCEGKGHYRAGTGGYVLLSDGTRWDYRKYNYWLHQPAKWTPNDNVASLNMCDHCGGTGRMPEAKVFGMFLPQAVEYIVPEGATDELKERMKERNFKLVSETQALKEGKRGCGKRIAGGVYVVTESETEASPEAVRAAVNELVESGVIKPEATELHGNFVRFLDPVDVEVKRFRGIKRWSLDPRAEDQAEMIMEAMAG